MKRFSLMALVCSIGLGTMFGQSPVIRSGTAAVVNNASYTRQGLPNAGIAQGSLFAIFGTNLGPANLSQVSSYPLGDLSGVSVSVTVNGTTKKCYVLYVVASQVGAVLPSDTPIGTGTVTVTYNNNVSNTSPITVVKSQFGIFTINQQGSGPAAVQKTDYSAVTLTNSTKPGDTITIWGTGLGPVDPATEATKPPTIAQMSGVQVYVGGKLATLVYAGRSGYTAIDQINVTIPSGVDGCYVPVAVVAGGNVSNFATISVSSTGKTCSDPLAFSAQQIQTAQANGVYSTGNINLSRSSLSLGLAGIPDITTDTGNASFLKYTYTKLLASSGVTAGLLSVSNSCVVFTFTGTDTTPVDAAAPTVLDAGPAINIKGPSGTAQMVKGTGGSYSATLGGGGIGGLGGKPPFLEPGSYTIDNGSGGADVGGFSVTLQLPAFITWTNEAAISTITRSAGQDITWSGGDPNGQVLMFGYSETGSGDNAVGAGFVCTEKNSAGHFTIPAPVLLALPASSSDGGGLLLVTGGTAAATFSATGLDKGTVIAAGGGGKQVAFQ